MISSIQANKERSSLDDFSSVSSKESAISSTTSTSELPCSTTEAVISIAGPNLAGCTNCQSNLLERKFAQLEHKIDTIFSLASALNSRSLEQNSQALFEMSEAQENRTSMKNAQCLNLVVRISYDEWNELYEFFNLYKQHRLERNTFSLFKNKSTFIEILNRRLLSRRLANQTLSNLIPSTLVQKGVKLDCQTDQELLRKELNIYTFIKKISDFNESFYTFIISHIDAQTLNSIDLSFDSSLPNTFPMNELVSLSEPLNELAKRSFNEKERLHLIEFGGAHAICELFTILWNFIEYFKNKNCFARPQNNLLLNDTIHKLSLNSIIVLCNSTVSPDLVGELHHKRYWLITVYSCLNKLLNNLILALKRGDTVLSDSIHDLIKSHVCLISKLSYRSETINGFDNSSFSSSYLAMNEVNFSKLLTKCAVVYSSKLLLKQRNLSLKIILQGLVNLSSLSMGNKESICNVKGSLKTLVNLLKPKTYSRDQAIKAIEELASSLLRSLSVHCSKNYALRKILRESRLYTVILDHSLLSNNLNIVANACGILWSLSAKSSGEQALLLDLGAEEKLTEMTKASNKLISIISMATLKNLQHLKSNGNRHMSDDPINNTNNNSSSLTDSTSGLDLSVSSSSSFSFYPVLSMGQRKQSKEESNDKNNEVSISAVLNKLTNLNELSFELSDMKDLDDKGSNTSLSSICSPNTSQSSSDSLVFSSDSTTSTFSNQSYELERRIKTKKSQMRAKDATNVSNKKHVTFSGMETFLFDTYSSDNNMNEKDSDTQHEEEAEKELNCAVEQIDLNDTELDLDESFDTLSEPIKSIQTNSLPPSYYFSYNPVNTSPTAHSPDANLSSLSSLLEPAKALISKIESMEQAELNLVDDNKLEIATSIATETGGNSITCMSPVSSAQNIFKKITPSRIPAKKKPKTLASCVTMTKTSQLRQNLSQQANRSESVQPKPALKPQIPKRTTSLQPSNKLADDKTETAEPKSSQSGSTTGGRTSSFIIMERIKKMSSKDNGQFV